MFSFFTKEDPDAQTELHEELKCEAEVGAVVAPISQVSEVWLNVFEKLETQDKPAFYRACEKWHDLVAPRRTQFLFQGLLPKLIESLPENKEVTKCREFCQSWTQEMDDHIQTHPSQLSLPFETDSDVGGGSVNCQVNFYHDSYQEGVKIQGFMEKMKNHPGNPFPGSCIYFGFKWDYWEWSSDEPDSGPDISREYWRKATDLLVKFGKYVYYVWFDPDVSCCRLGLPGLEMEVILRNCLLNLPNLRKLSIRGHGFSNSNEDEIRDFYRRNPLPLLENLETLELYDCGSSAMRKAVLSSCCVPSKIKRLTLHSCDEIANTSLDYIFPNLEVLNTGLSNQNLGIFRRLTSPHPLKKLRLNCAGITAQQLFWAVLPFAQTLVHLNIWNNRLVLDPEDVRISFPNLKTLEIAN